MQLFSLVKGKFQINDMLRKSNVAYSGTCKRKMDLDEISKMLFQSFLEYLDSMTARSKSFAFFTRA